MICSIPYKAYSADAEVLSGGEEHRCTDMGPRANKPNLFKALELALELAPRKAGSVRNYPGTLGAGRRLTPLAECPKLLPLQELLVLVFAAQFWAPPCRRPFSSAWASSEASRPKKVFAPRRDKAVPFSRQRKRSVSRPGSCHREASLRGFACPEGQSRAGSLGRGEA